jgi:hypothetical protein
MNFGPCLGSHLITSDDTGIVRIFPMSAEQREKEPTQLHEAQLDDAFALACHVCNIGLLPPDLDQVRR